MLIDWAILQVLAALRQTSLGLLDAGGVDYTRLGKLRTNRNEMKPIIQTKNLCKIFRGGIDAVQDVSLTVYPGELFGLFGPNGAGKSTIVRLLSPSSGRATVNGFDVVADEIEVRASIGLVSADERSFYGRLTAVQNLHFYAAMQN